MRTVQLVLALGFVSLLTACGAVESRSSVARRVPGPLEIRTAGMVLEDIEVNGPVDVYASNVTIRRARITCGPYWCVRQHDGATGLLIEDADIGPTLPRPTADGLWVQSFTGRRLDIHGVSDGVKAWSDVRIEDSRIHDLTRGVDDHSDGVQVQSGQDIVLDGNIIESGTHAAVFIASETGAVSDVVVRGNVLRGGTFTLSVRTGPFGPPQRIQLLRNRFGGAPQYGAYVADVPVEAVGNVVEAGSADQPSRAGK